MIVYLFHMSCMRHSGRILIGVVFLLVTLLGSVPVRAQESSSPWRPVIAAVHVHSNVSTGNDSLDELAVQAQAAGIDAIFLTDNFLLRYEYGLFPLRGLVQRTIELPSIMQVGMGRYLTQVREAGARHPQVMLIPGVEVVPQYYWTGSVFAKDLTMHDSQKNILVMGLPTGDDYAGLPVAGNRAAYKYGWMAVLWLSPVLLAIPAFWLFSHPVHKKVGTGWTLMTVRSHRTVPIVILLALAGLLLVNNYPFGTPAYDLYQDGNGLRPHQGLIDYVRERGGLTFWSMPEVKDFTRYNFGRLGVVTVETNPYPEALLQTSGFTGFGTIYQHGITVTDAGGLWDATLHEYTTGRRARPSWGLGEVAYHQAGSAGTYLYSVETVLWAKEQTPAALLDAMAKGRMYALVRTKEYGLALNDFSLLSSSTGERVISGETLRIATGDIRIHVAVTATDGSSRSVPVQVIRSGRVMQSLTEKTPFDLEYHDVAPVAGETAYYRLLIGSPGNRIVSNPIFVRG
jgi:hypothetical protein